MQFGKKPEERRALVAWEAQVTRLNATAVAPMVGAQSMVVDYLKNMLQRGHLYSVPAALFRLGRAAVGEFVDPPCTPAGIAEAWMHVNGLGALDERAFDFSNMVFMMVVNARPERRTLAGQSRIESRTIVHVRLMRLLYSDDDRIGLAPCMTETDVLDIRPWLSTEGFPAIVAGLTQWAILPRPVLEVRRAYMPFDFNRQRLLLAPQPAPLPALGDAHEEPIAAVMEGAIVPHAPHGGADIVPVVPNSALAVNSPMPALIKVANEERLIIDLLNGRDAEIPWESAAVRKAIASLTAAGLLQAAYSDGVLQSYQVT